MNLRTQILLAGALTLAIPAVGWHSVKQLDASLKETREDEQRLMVTNARLALAEATNLQTLLRSDREYIRVADLYAEFAAFPIFTDGYSDDWRNLQSPAITLRTAEHRQDSAPTASMEKVSVGLAQRNSRLYLFIDVTDDNVIYHKPTTPRTDLGEEELLSLSVDHVSADAIEIFIVNTDGVAEHIIFRTVAPGRVLGLDASSIDNTLIRDSSGGIQHSSTIGASLASYRGVWVANQHGFQLEMNIPLPAIGSTFGFAFVDVDQRDGLGNTWIGTLAPADMRRWQKHGASRSAGRLFYTSEIAASRLAPWVTSGVRARLFDRAGRLLADVNSLYDKSAEQDKLDPAGGSFFNAVLFRLFGYFVSTELRVMTNPWHLRNNLHLMPNQLTGLSVLGPQTLRYITEDNDKVLGTLMPIGGEQPVGFLLFESNEDVTTAYSSSRLARLFSLLTLVSLFAGCVLFAYASVLSIRIRRLSQQAQRAVADDGRVLGLPGSHARDEIGDLSRNLSALLTRSANYTQYLEALSSRLSHELRTPLSVVKTSIENMNRDNLDTETRTLLDRASTGADQLGVIIRALVESTRLEQTVQQSEMVALDMVAWLEGSIARYQQIYSTHRIISCGSLEQLLTPGEGADNATVVKTYQGGKNLSPITRHASPELLEQAFDKLVDNAISFATHDEVKLLMAIENSGAKKSILLAVANRGATLSEENLPLLFNPMYTERQASDGRSHLGLGLYIVGMIAEAHGGSALAMNHPPYVIVGMRLPLDQPDHRLNSSS